MRINDAIALQQARQAEKNKSSGAKPRHNFTTKTKIGRMIWTTQSKNRPLISMSELSNGKNKTIRVGWVYIICRECKVDANFLFRQPSKHDADFERLIGSKQK